MKKNLSPFMEIKTVIIRRAYLIPNDVLHTKHTSTYEIRDGVETLIGGDCDVYIQSDRQQTDKASKRRVGRPRK